MGDERAAGDGTSIDTAAWRGRLSTGWLSQASRLEAMLAPVDDPLLASAAPALAESVLDVGCGRGVTARRVAELVGVDGRVVGVDVSVDTIAAAGSIDAAPDSAPIEWIAADAAALSLDRPVDLVVSRFGVMFFDDPVAAFTNLRTVTRPEGRLAVAVWLPRTQSEFQRRSLDTAVAAAHRLGVHLHLPDPVSGPFRYGDREWFTGVLEDAGWRQVGWEPCELHLHVGGPGTSAAEAAALGMANGPLAMLTGGLEDDLRREIEHEVAVDLERAWDGTGVRLAAGIAVVTARHM